MGEWPEGGREGRRAVKPGRVWLETEGRTHQLSFVFMRGVGTGIAHI